MTQSITYISTMADQDRRKSLIALSSVSREHRFLDVDKLHNYLIYMNYETCG